jgi:hypothetical protein
MDAWGCSMRRCSQGQTSHVSELAGPADRETRAHVHDSLIAHGAISDPDVHKL